MIIILYLTQLFFASVSLYGQFAYKFLDDPDQKFLGQCVRTGHTGFLTTWAIIIALCSGSLAIQKIKRRK